MNTHDLAKYCLSKLGSVLDYPFGDDTPVFKTGEC